MAQRFGNGKVGVVQRNVFADKTDGNALFAVVNFTEHIVPVAHVDVGRVDSELAADDGGKVAFFKHYRRFIKHGKRKVFNNAVGLNVAEH